jgi:uncharacterized protein YndB with AHSA1/START domain
MHEIEVLDQIRAPIETVFEALSDHERFFRGHGVRSCVVTTPGTTEKNGLGAVRTIEAFGQRFAEEVIRFERPTRFDYRIRSVTMFGRKLPMKHELGWIELSEGKGGTKVAWRSRFTVGVPLIGDRIARLAASGAERAFRGLMKQAKRELESAQAVA